MKNRILVVDDSQDTLEIIRRNLLKSGYTVFTATNVLESIDFLKREKVDLVITDMKMPQVSGMELVKHINDNFLKTRVIMITGYGSIDNAVEAVKRGAEEFLSKPFTDEELLKTVEKVLSKLEKERLSQEPPQENPFGIVGKSPTMRGVFELIRKAAKVDATVLITGESGTGKELVARAIHYGSTRAAAPFVPVNCGGIPSELLESELFGHVKGSFTGANETRAGFFQTADKGSILLDEIGETSRQMQVKLLRALQEKVVTMVGSRKGQKVDVRIIAATNKNLNEMVNKDMFREDLFYRLNVIALELPPLRERGDDVLLLSQTFLSKYAIEMDRKPPSLSDEVIDIFKGYEWPGNVRELENIIQRLTVMVESERIEVHDLPKHMRHNLEMTPGVQRTLKQVEMEHIKRVLQSTDGNKTKAATILDIDRKTLRKKVKEFGLE